VPLRRGRIDEIARGLVRGEFPCHKTVNHSRRNQGKEQHCAGALIMLEKMDQPSQMMRICERIGLYDRTKLKMDSPVVASPEEIKPINNARNPI